MARSFRLADNIETQQTVWVLDKEGKQLELDPIQVCAFYRKKYAHEVRRVTF
jgi:hypothetical protein